jgi:hypothetical protein
VYLHAREIGFGFVEKEQLQGEELHVTTAVGRLR